MIQKGVLDSSPGWQYMLSFYWAFQTITTVGYGDYNANGNVYQEILAIFWLLFGVGFQSSAIGTIISIIQLDDQEQEEINEKI